MRARARSLRALLPHAPTFHVQLLPASRQRLSRSACPRPSAVPPQKKLSAFHLCCRPTCQKPASPRSRAGFAPRTVFHPAENRAAPSAADLPDTASRTAAPPRTASATSAARCKAPASAGSAPHPLPPLPPAPSAAPAAMPTVYPQHRRILVNELRVILKLHHIVVSVRAPHQVRLGAAAHPPDLLQSLD